MPLQKAEKLTALLPYLNSIKEGFILVTINELKNFLRKYTANLAEAIPKSARAIDTHPKK